MGSEQPGRSGPGSPAPQPLWPAAASSWLPSQALASSAEPPSWAVLLGPETKVLWPLSPTTHVPLPQNCPTETAVSSRVLGAPCSPSKHKPMDTGSLYPTPFMGLGDRLVSVLEEQCPWVTCSPWKHHLPSFSLLLLPHHTTTFLSAWAGGAQWPTPRTPVLWAARWPCPASAWSCHNRAHNESQDGGFMSSSRLCVCTRQRCFQKAFPPPPSITRMDFLFQLLVDAINPGMCVCACVCVCATSSLSTPLLIDFKNNF